jgi:hypothetical protein
MSRPGDLAGDALLFGTGDGTPLSLSNLRRRVWLPLLARAGVRTLPLYALWRTPITYARAAGETAYNVSRMVGHSRSVLVDQVYGQSLATGVAGVTASIESRLYPAVPTPPTVTPPSKPRRRGKPALRLLKRGSAWQGGNEVETVGPESRGGRKPLILLALRLDSNQRQKCLETQPFAEQCAVNTPGKYPQSNDVTLGGDGVFPRGSGRRRV